MPRRSDISSVLVIGSGPIVIGQSDNDDPFPHPKPKPFDKDLPLKDATKPKAPITAGATGARSRPMLNGNLARNAGSKVSAAEIMISVSPPGCARATRSSAIAPVAPGRFTTTTD